MDYIARLDFKLLFCVHSSKFGKCLFNEHFINAGPALANSIPNTANRNPLEYINTSPESSFAMSYVIETQVYDLLSSLDPNKASIHIPNQMIKIGASIIAPIITNLYNESISEGIVPDILKIARVTPIYKSGVTTDPTNYRPISILSPFAKVLEKLVHKQLESFLEKHSLLFSHQFGFRKGHSTEQAILEISDYLKNKIDEKKLLADYFWTYPKHSTLSTIKFYSTN